MSTDEPTTLRPTATSFNNWTTAHLAQFVDELEHQAVPHAEPGKPFHTYDAARAELSNRARQATDAVQTPGQVDLLIGRLTATAPAAVLAAAEWVLTQRTTTD